jgi:hypothetical protein
MLSFVFFILAVAAAAAGFLLLAGIAQVAAWVVAALFIALFVFGMVRKTDRPWRQTQ